MMSAEAPQLVDQYWADQLTISPDLLYSEALLACLSVLNVTCTGPRRQLKGRMLGAVGISLVCNKELRIYDNQISADRLW